MKVDSIAHIGLISSVRIDKCVHIKVSRFNIFEYMNRTVTHYYKLFLRNFKPSFHVFFSKGSHSTMHCAERSSKSKKSINLGISFNTEKCQSEIVQYDQNKITLHCVFLSLLQYCNVDLLASNIKLNHCFTSSLILSSADPALKRINLTPEPANNRAYLKMTAGVIECHWNQTFSNVDLQEWTGGRWQ